jgi:DNA-directed RNA polymerase subunit K/omega
MDIIDNLTNEEISKKFNNQFDLVNYAIKLATNMIQTGREPRVRMNTENPALLILEEIAEGKDVFIEAPKEKKSLVHTAYSGTKVEEEKTEVVKESFEEDLDDDELLEEEETQEVLS